MNRNINLNEEDENQRTSENILLKEETSLLLSMVDINILQNIFIQLVDQYKYSIDEEQELKKAFTLLLNFSSTCKLFENISKQPLFPLILNNININLNHKKYLKILFIKQEIEKNNWYKQKDINDIFYQTCDSGDYDLINTLIKYGANINHPQGCNNQTPLLIATFEGNIKTVKKLIKYKRLNINEQTTTGTTSLIWSCIYGQENIFKILLSRKDINISMKDDKGKTALDWAKQFSHEKIIHILENYQNSNCNNEM